MQTALFHIRVLVFVAVHLVAGVGLEVGHTDLVPVSASGQAAFAQHTCAGNERHVAIGHLHGCLACCFQMQHLGAPGDVARAGAVPTHRLGLLPVAPRLPLQPSLHHSGLRGPPCA